MIDVFLCAPRSLLMDQVKIAESRLFMCTEFEQYVLCSEFVGSGNSIIASIKNVAGPIPRELQSSSNAPGLDWDKGIGEARGVFLRAELIERRVS